MKIKDLNYYMGLSYNMVVQHRADEDSECYESRVLELDGCHSHGYTREEALENLREAMEGYIEAKLEFNDPIPEPSNYSDYNGKFLIKLPKSLHYTLATEAEREGVSLDQHVLYKLAK